MIIEKTNIILGDNVVGHMEELKFGKKRMPKAIFKQIENLHVNQYNMDYLNRTDVSILGYVIDYVTVHGGIRGLGSYTTAKNEHRNYLIYNSTTNKFNRVSVPQVYHSDYYHIFNKALEQKGVHPKQLIVGA